MKQLFTKWGKELNPNNILTEYPRPQMQRDSYLNLNGEWNYSISKTENPNQYDGTILVPFSPESILSGVNRFVGPDDILVYQKDVVLPQGFRKDRLILHFGAVDQEVQVYINDLLAISHLGGFTPFQVEINDYIQRDSFSIKVVVRDITDLSYRQTGKQRIKRGGIFYTPQSGIWQTVWLESVPKNYIHDIRISIDFDNNTANINLLTDTKLPALNIEAKLFFHDTLVSQTKGIDDRISFHIEDLNPWTPDTPNLYTYEITYGEDLIKGYFGMRKFERKADDFGIMRFYLNNQPILLSGVLDQGYYPDGLLTPPSDEAMIYDIQTMKEYGFNFIRKHIKIEPLRWYYHCDRLGIIVWQDMINGSTIKDVISQHALSMINIHLNDKYHCLFGRRDEAGRAQYKRELDELLHHLVNITCISTWVPFNESWGQFDALQIEKHVRKFDPTRLIDHASGWADQKGGDYHSRHIYFQKIRFPMKKAKKRILALTEFGGYSYRIKEHSFNPDEIFGYKVFETKEDLDQAVKKLYETQILPEIQKGLSALVYTQLSDVEDEVNGFVTYDRLVQKIDVDMMKQINDSLHQAFFDALTLK